MIVLTKKGNEHGFVPPTANITGERSPASKYTLSYTFTSPFQKGRSFELLLNI